MIRFLLVFACAAVGYLFWGFVSSVAIGGEGAFGLGGSIGGGISGLLMLFWSGRRHRKTTVEIAPGAGKEIAGVWEVVEENEVGYMLQRGNYTTFIHKKHSAIMQVRRGCC